MPRKDKEYLPLRMCKEYQNLLQNLGVGDFDPAQITKAMSVTGLAEWEKLDPIERAKQGLVYNIIKHQLHEPMVQSHMMIHHCSREIASTDVTRELYSMGLLATWSKNKQVFKLDADFMEELLKTDNYVFTKDVFEYLPYKTFYIDLSDCIDIAEQVKAHGICLTVNNVKGYSQYPKRLDLSNTNASFEGEASDDKWIINYCALYDFSNRNLPAMCKYDHLIYENADIEFRLDNISQAEMAVLDFGDKSENAVVNVRLLSQVITQMLLYLSQPEKDKDIIENAETKQTYRQPRPDAKPKNKFSEVRQWDVGVRSGNAFRDWKENHKDEQSEEMRTGKKGGTKRPHIRRAHWHRYPHTNEDGEKVWIPRWLSAITVNIDKDKTDQLPTVVHEAGKLSPSLDER